MKANIEGERIELVSDTGDEVMVMTNALFQCTGPCGLILPADEFGFALRRMDKTKKVWRNQPQCKACRGRYR